MVETPGPVVMFGSGETSPSGRRAHEWVLSKYATPVRVAILETPAGFQPNSAIVAGKIAEFLRTRLQNHRPEVTVIPARARLTPFSPDDPAILSPVLRSHVVFAGPGSPTYAARQLEDSLALRYLQASHRLGAALVLASAATVAAGSHCLPVYEIYKSGEDIHWKSGLDLFRPFGISLTFVPHWNNSEGGADLDTSRCFMGQERFRRLLAMLPSGVTVVGIDEQTSLVLDLSKGVCRVMGRGGVTVLHDGQERRHGTGTTFPVGELGTFRFPEPREGIPSEVWEAALAAREESSTEEVPADVLAIVRSREAARNARNWSEADRLRELISSMGWSVSDTLDGPVLDWSQPAPVEAHSYRSIP